MHERVRTIFRSIANLGDVSWGSGYQDSYGHLKLSEGKVRALSSNPYVSDRSVPAQIIGLIGQRIIGSVGTFPYQIVADGGIYEATANPATYVDPEYRKTGYAIELGEIERTLSKDRITFDFGLSRSARKLAEMCGYKVFKICQHTIVRRSSNLLGKRLPIPLCVIADVLLFPFFLLWTALIWIKTNKVHVRPVDDANLDTGIAEFCSLVSKDKFRFRVNVDEKWVRWVLSNHFNDLVVATKKLQKVYCGRSPVGYVLTEFSACGQVGKIVEWQFSTADKRLEANVLLKVALKLIWHCQHVTLSVSAADCRLNRELDWWMLPFPSQVAVVGAGVGSPLLTHDKWDCAANWRLRPGIGDSCLY